MQPDYSLYEEMVRRGSRGRWFWRAGSWLYVAGLLGICLILAVWPVAFFFGFGKTSVYYAAALLAMGSFLKKISYRLALGEGIDITRYIDKPADGSR